MFYKTYEVLQARLDYTKNVDGSWIAEFDGPFAIRVTESSLERCRNRVIEALDERLAEFLSAPAVQPSGTGRAQERRKPL
jgi:hypothetical protein